MRGADESNTYPPRLLLALDFFPEELPLVTGLDTDVRFYLVNLLLFIISLN